MCPQRIVLPAVEGEEASGDEDGDDAEDDLPEEGVQEPVPAGSSNARFSGLNLKRPAKTISLDESEPAEKKARGLVDYSDSDVEVM